MSLEDSKRKKRLIVYYEHQTGLTLRGNDTRVAKTMISLMWKMGFNDKHICEAIDYWLGVFSSPAFLTFPYLYRNMERWELANENVVQSSVIKERT